ncbi:MAG: ParB/RepB/Spo0J family partition protein [Candidatus Eremiobacteraeota bacterium]|nr:ParB/RepB/Spo0J family partition protein [Candidatus Eremiobacteraeota bacterium]
MSVRRGLGRGLGALLGEDRRDAPAGTPLGDIRVDAIRPNPQQPRQTFDGEAQGELEASIRELGVLVPIIVRRLPGESETYELIAGERRWRAAAAAHLPSIPAMVREADDRASLEVAIVENLQREDLDPLEEAMGLRHLMEKYQFTQERLAERIGKSRPAVANALRLLGLSDPIKTLLRAGSISFGHARALLAVDPAIREALAQRIERDGLTVRDVERLGRARPERRAKAASPAAPSPDVEAVIARLRYRLGAPVAIVSGTGRGGKLEIRYSDADDLARVVDLLLLEE